MAFYEAMIGGLNESYINEDAEVEQIMESMDDEVCTECEDDPFSAFLRVACENELNYNNIMNAVAMEEVKYLKETGEDLVWEAGRLSSVKDKLMSAVDTVWNKIKSIVKAVLDKFNEWNKADANFLKKYEKDIMKANGTTINDYTGYKFSLDNTIPIIARCSFSGISTVDGYKGLYKALNTSHTSDANDAASDFASNYDSYFKQARGYIVKGTKGDPIDSNNVFKKAIHNELRSGGDKVKISKFDNASNVVAEIKNAKNSKANVKRIYDNSKKKIAEAKKDINTLFKSSDKNANSKYISTVSRALNALISWLTIAMHECVNAIAQNNRQNKALAMAAVRVSNKNSKDDAKKDDKKGSVDESFSFLDDVQLI